MGGLIFLIMAVLALVWLIKFLRSIENIPGRVRQNIVWTPPEGYQISTSVPIVQPIEEEKIPPQMERLPQIDPSLLTELSPISSPVSHELEVLPNFDLSKAKTEESLLYRVLVQVLFSVSAIGADYAMGTGYSIVAIPFTTLGASWSWYRRHYAQTWLNKMVAMGSLAVGFVLIRNLVLQKPLAGSLWLAIMAVGIQMGLSFNLYDRKTLGYCLLSSTVLMGVAAHSLQSPLFAISIGMFVAIVVPILMLDYRSRLGCQPIGIGSASQRKYLSYRYLPWQQLAQLAGIALGAGLLLSLLLTNLRLPHLSLPPNPINNPNATTSQPITAANPPAAPREMASKVFAQSGNNYPAEIKSENLQLPPQLNGELQQFTNKILAASPQPIASDFDRAAYLADYLKQQYQTVPTASNATQLDANSIRQAIAKCQTAPHNCRLTGDRAHIPALHAAMLRSIGIPTRLKAGEQLAQIDPQSRLYPRLPEPTQTQTQVYVPGWGWFNIDTAPDRPLLAATDRQAQQLQQQFQELSALQPPPSPNSTPAATLDPHQNTPPAGINAERDNSPAPNPANLPKLPELPKLPNLPDWNANPVIIRTIFLALLLAAGGFWLWRTYKTEQQRLAKLPPIERIYRSMLVAVGKNHRAKLASQTQLEYAQSIAAAEHPQIAKVVTEISELYTAWRYGKKRIDPNQLMKKLQYLQHLQKLAAQRQVANPNTTLDRRS